MKYALFFVIIVLVFGSVQLTDLIFSNAYGSSPLKQINLGIKSTDVTCNEGLELVIKLSNGHPACVKPSSVAKLIERGWAIHILPDVDSSSKNSNLIQSGKYDVETSLVDYANYTGFLARPISNETFPGVIMIHEWWGLNENMKETAKKLASQGYVVLAVDLFHGSVATDAQKAMEMVSNFDEQQAIVNMNGAVNHLQTSNNIGKIGSIGWCFGGGQSLNLALNNKNIDATVIYYGKLVTEKEALSKIKSPVLGIFGELDQGIPVEKVNEFENALTDLEIPNIIHIYPGVDHAFANPTGARYAPVETEDAWNKTLEFFKNNLS
jgi:carboxymethylenebutenolidase